MRIKLTNSLEPSRTVLAEQEDLSIKSEKTSARLRITVTSNSNATNSLETRDLQELLSLREYEYEDLSIKTKTSKRRRQARLRITRMCNTKHPKTSASSSSFTSSSLKLPLLLPRRKITKRLLLRLLQNGFPASNKQSNKRSKHWPTFRDFSGQGRHGLWQRLLAMARVEELVF